MCDTRYKSIPKSDAQRAEVTMFVYLPYIKRMCEGVGFEPTLPHNKGEGLEPLR